MNMKVEGYEECDECGVKITGSSYRVSGPFQACQNNRDPMTFCSEDCLVEWLNGDKSDLKDVSTPAVK